MRKALGPVLTLVVFSSLLAFETPTVSASKRTLATIRGSVTDNKGNPVAGALISLLRDGAKEVIKQTWTSSDGSFSSFLGLVEVKV